MTLPATQNQSQGQTLPLRAAAYQALRAKGTNVLRSYQVFLGMVLDHVDPDAQTTRTLEYNCDQELLDVYVDAAAARNEAGIATAATRASYLLRERGVRDDVADQIACELALALANLLTVGCPEQVRVVATRHFKTQGGSSTSAPGGTGSSLGQSYHGATPAHGDASSSPSGHPAHDSSAAGHAGASGGASSPQTGQTGSASGAQVSSRGGQSGSAGVKVPGATPAQDPSQIVQERARAAQAVAAAVAIRARSGGASSGSSSGSGASADSGSKSGGTSQTSSTQQISASASPQELLRQAKADGVGMKWYWLLRIGCWPSALSNLAYVGQMLAQWLEWYSKGTLVLDSVGWVNLAYVVVSALCGVYFLVSWKRLRELRRTAHDTYVTTVFWDAVRPALYLLALGLFAGVSVDWAGMSDLFWARIVAGVVLWLTSDAYLGKEKRAKFFVR